MKTLTLILLLLLPGSLLAQQTDASVKYRVTGIENSLRIGNEVLVDDGVKVGLEPTGTFKVDTEASLVTVVALNEKFEPVPVREVEPKFFFILGSGKIRLTVTCVDFDKKIFEQKNEMLEIGPPTPPEPPVPPEPDVSPDQFDNIGQRVQGWSQGLPSNKEFGEAYHFFSLQIRSDVRTVSTLTNDLSVKLKTIPNYSQYTSVLENLRADAAQRFTGTVTKSVVSLYWEAIAKGFGYGS